jgi:hypothetical protein
MAGKCDQGEKLPGSGGPSYDICHKKSPGGKPGLFIAKQVLFIFLLV